MEKLSFIGNAGKDAVLEKSRSGKSVCRFSVAVPGRRDAQGNREARWRDVETWDTLAENCARYVRKGMKVYVEGIPEVEAWQGRDGKVRGTLVCRAAVVEFLSREAAEEPAGAAGVPAGYTPVPSGDDELPF